MTHYLLAVTATAAVPAGVLGWMMGVAALALVSNGENPRAALAIPGTFFRGGRAARRDDHRAAAFGRDAIGD